VPSLHHLALRTHDVERLVDFYREWFGLPEARDARPRSVWLRLDAAVIMIERAQASEPSIARESLELIALRVSADERIALRARLLEAGALEAETEHTLYFRDPDGRRVGASTYPL
jgi:catechol 2,3-dioxygenase-like lactoylglutathione lyase family enzyme